MSGRRILVVNPNSNESVTRGLDAALADIARRDALDIACVTLAGAPFGIETDEDIRRVVPLLVDEVGRKAGDCDAVVIACYSDPGLVECRAGTAKPVYGIQESAARLAADRGLRFGVLALGGESIRRHVAYVRQLGLEAFHAGERPLGISVDAAANDPATLDRILDAGRELIAEYEADMLVLGCAGLAAHRRAAEQALGVPVIDPVQAAVGRAAQHLDRTAGVTDGK